MKPERGQFRAIPQVLLDGPDFQSLSPEARNVFVFLKIGMGPCGIEVEYPDALVARLVAQTGRAAAVVRAMLDELEGAGWIRREANILWIVEHLRFEPSLAKGNPNHRKSVESHVRGLPRRAIVGAFVEHYRDWFDKPDALRRDFPKAPPADPIAIPSRSHPNPIAITETETEDRRPKTDGVPPSAARGPEPDGPPPRPALSFPAPKGGWPAEFAALYEPIGLRSVAEIGRVLKPVVAKYGLERAREMWGYYIRHGPSLRFGQLTPGHWDTSRMSPADFVKNAGTWFQKTQPLSGGGTDAATAG